MRKTNYFLRIKFKDETYNTYNILCIINILYSTCIFTDELSNHTTFGRT